MLRMAVLDDREDKRASVVNGLNAFFADQGWECVPCPLSNDISSYLQWIQDKNIAVLIVDQLLNEQSSDESKDLDSMGHQVVAEIRRAVPTFPIVIITVNNEDEDLQDHLGEPDYILSRTQLLQESDEHVPRMIRMGQKYAENHEYELAEMTRLSTTIASGEGSDEDFQRLQALQQKLSLALGKSTKADTQLNELQKQVAKLEALQMRLKQHFEKGEK